MATLPARARDSIRPVAPIAVFTIVQDEPEFLPVWRAHYAQVGDLYVLDHDSTVPVEGGLLLHHKWSWDFEWWHDMVQQFQEALFAAGYQTVVFSTVDELLVPTHITLADYLRREHGSVIRPTAFDLVDMSRASVGYDQFDTPMGPCWQDIRDRAIIWDHVPIWTQRHWWVRQPSYDKPLIIGHPYFWSWGLHSVREDDPAPDPNLRLLHLHRLDYENTKIRHARHQHRLNHEDITKWGSGGHNLLMDGKPFDDWFYGDVAARDRTPWSQIHAGIQ